MSVLLAEELLQTCVLCVSIVELTLESVELILIHSLQSVYVRNLVPCALAQVEGQTHLSIEVIVLVFPSAQSVRVSVEVAACAVAIEVFLQTVPATFNVYAHIVAQAPRRLQTDAQLHSVEVGLAVAGETTTGERNHVPHTVGVVAEEQVAHVEHHVLVQCPVLHAVASVVVVGDSLAPDTLQLGAESDARCEPLTDSDRSARVATELLERAV